MAFSSEAWTGRHSLAPILPFSVCVGRDWTSRCWGIFLNWDPNPDAHPAVIKWHGYLSVIWPAEGLFNSSYWPSVWGSYRGWSLAWLPRRKLKRHRTW